MLKKILCNSRWHKLLLVIIVFVFYGNSFQNEFALDDVLVITGNRFVKKGISGIKDILFHDSFYGASGKVAKASGGRYRPLSIIFFAIEKEFFGMKPFVFHFFNVLFYSILCLLIYQFLIRHVFKENNTAAFLSVFLFAIHPIHTEVIANIKSRDEILSLLFLVSTLHYLLRYFQSGKLIHAVISLLSYALALLSKEYGAMFLLIIPLTIFVFTKGKMSDVIRSSIPYWLIFAGYLMLRYSINKIAAVDEKDVLNSPYLLATGSQKFATIAWVFLQYIKLMFFPFPLSYDYSYNQVSYVNFSNAISIASVIIHAGGLLFALVSVYKKNLVGYFLLVYLLLMLMTSNILVNIATPLAERFLFGPGLFLIVAGILFIAKKIPLGMIRHQSLLLFVFLVPGIPAFYEVFQRNKDWKNNETLYFKDVRTASNSARAQAFCGMNLVTSTDQIKDSTIIHQTLQEALPYFYRAYTIYPDFGNMYQNWGLAYYRMNQIDSAAWAWNRYKTLSPDNPFAEMNEDALGRSYYNIYVAQYKEAQNLNDTLKMLTAFREAVRHYNKLPESWLILGHLYQLNNLDDSAKMAWRKCLELQPENQQALALLKDFQARKK